MHATLEDLARAKGVNATYVSRVLRLTLLAPDIVEAILDGRQPAELQLDDLLKGFPLEWQGQLIHFAHYCPSLTATKRRGRIQPPPKAPQHAGETDVAMAFQNTWDFSMSNGSKRATLASRPFGKQCTRVCHD